ncbi:MAG: YIP1 family protein [candidate division Zixibacteria bacterium]
METNFNSQNVNGGEGKHSIWRIIPAVIYSPVKAFEDYNKNPKLLFPIILVVILTGLFAAATTEYSAKLQYEIMQTSTVLPPAALEQMKSDYENPNYLKAGLFGAGFGLIPGLLAALVAWGVGTFFFGGTTKFTRVWGVSLLIGVIGLLASFVIKWPLMAASGSAQASIGFAAFFHNLGITSIFYLFLLYIDAIAIWLIILSGLAYSVVFGISRGKGMATSIITTLILVITMIGLQVIGMSFAGIELSWF